MGVFSRFRRKADAASRSRPRKCKAATPTAEPGGRGSTPTHGGVRRPRLAEASEAAAESEAEEPAEAAAAEGVEIPKQQSAEEAADNEAGEGARK